MHDTLDSGRASIADLEKADAVVVRKFSRRLAKGQIRDTKRNSQGRNLSPVEWAEIKSRLTIEEGEHEANAGRAQKKVELFFGRTCGEGQF